MRSKCHACEGFACGHDQNSTCDFQLQGVSGMNDKRRLALGPVASVPRFYKASVAELQPDEAR